MPVITINGPIGSGAADIGQIVAEKLEIDFVDRLILSEASKLVEAPVGALIDKEQRVASFRDRLGRFMVTMLERSVLSSGMYSGGALMTLPPEAFDSLEGDVSTESTALQDKDFIEATTTVVNGLCEKGNVVIIGRGANMILTDSPGVFHVGLIAPIEVRTENLMRRENLERDEAEAYVEELERAHATYFRKFFQVEPSEPRLYHTILNMGKMQPLTAAEVIVQASQDLDSTTLTNEDGPCDAEGLLNGRGDQGR